MTERSRFSIKPFDNAGWLVFDTQDPELSIARIVENNDPDLVSFGHDLPLEVHGIGLPCHGVVARAKDLDHACARIETFLAIRDNTPILSESEIKTAADEGWALAVASHKARILKSSSRAPFKTDTDAHMYVWEKDQAGDPLCTKALTALIVKDSEFYQAVYEDGIDPLIQMKNMDAQDNVSLEFQDNRSEKEKNSTRSAYGLTVHLLDDPVSTAVNVFAFDSDDASAFYRAMLEGALYLTNDRILDVRSLVEKLDWPEGVAARDCTLRLHDGGMPSPLLFGDYDASDRIVQLSATAGFAMQSLKEIAEFSYDDIDGNAFLCADRGEIIMSRANHRHEIADMLASAPLFKNEALNGEISLLRHHPALSALNGIAASWYMDKDKGVLIDAANIDALDRVHQVASMTTTDLLAESVKSMLTTYQLDRFASFSYDEAAFEVLDLADKGELSVDVATTVSKALMMASRFFEVTTEFEMEQDNLLSAQPNRNNSEPSF